MPIFPKLLIDYPICHKHKTNCSIPSPGGSNKTKDSTNVNSNKMLLVRNATTTNSKTIDLKSIFNTKEIDDFKSLLSSRSDMCRFCPLPYGEYLRLQISLRCDLSFKSMSMSLLVSK